jgi:hypothetical protein
MINSVNSLFQRMPIPARQVHIFGLRGNVQGAKLLLQFRGVLRLNPRLIIPVFSRHCKQLDPMTALIGETC